MDGRPRALITYDGLPVSAGGAHRVRSRDRAATWRRIRGFLGAFTTYDEPDDVGLSLAGGPRADQEFFDRAYAATVAAFGAPKERAAMPGPPQEHEYRWTLGASHIEPALAHLRALEPFPEHWLGAPLVLHVRATFRLCASDSGEPFPDQDPALYGHQEAAWKRPLGGSQIYLRLTTATTCGLFLSLPFAEVTPELSAYIVRLDESLPFRLSRKHWSRWQLNARGTRYYSRRIDVGAGA